LTETRLQRSSSSSSIPFLGSLEHNYLKKQGFHNKNDMEEPQLPEYTLCAPVRTDSGMLSGLRLPDDLRAFRGIPYAVPPTGNLRWRPPQPLPPWEGVRSGIKFGSSSFQFPPPATSLYYGGETDFSEDCLYLNIWTGAEGTRNRPVLVWFHFGAFQFGSASNPMYDGTKLAADGITVVTVNYRLGRFGFLAHPELSDESGYHGSGNYGIMDQIAALNWIQRNIETFGGDSRNVTIGGASAGGGSVQILRSSPLAKQLFSKAICESAAGVAPTIDGRGHVAAYTTLAAAESAGKELLDFLGVSSIAKLREMPPAKILAAHLPHTKGPWKSDLWPGSTSLSIFDTGNPIVDGYVLPESPLDALVAGRWADVPSLVGNVGNEASGLPHLDSLVDYHAYVDEAFGELAEEALRLYPATADLQVRASSLQLLADQVFVWPTWTSARLQARSLRSSAWYYILLRAPPVSLESNGSSRAPFTVPVWCMRLEPLIQGTGIGPAMIRRFQKTSPKLGFSFSALETPIMLKVMNFGQRCNRSMIQS
jgi:para-nitrobenzyl esterase